MTTTHANDDANEMMKDKVLARIKKMLTLGNDPGAAEGERDNALRMAHTLLAKYNMSMSDVDNAAGKGEKRGEDKVAHYGYPWARRMSSAIGLLFFCRYFFMPIRSDKCYHVFVGRASNVKTAMDMATFVIESILKEANARRRQRMNDGLGLSWDWHTAFCKGAAERIIERCIEIQANAEKASKPQATGNGTALVLASFYKQELEANTAYMNANHKLRQGKNREHASRADGRAAGRAHGDSINLSRQVGSNGNNGSKRLR